MGIRLEPQDTVLTRAAVMFAVSVILPLLPASPSTTIVIRPFLLTTTFRTRGLRGFATGFGMASAASMEPTASAAPPVTVTPCIPASGFAPRLSASTT